MTLASMSLINSLCYSWFIYNHQTLVDATLVSVNGSFPWCDVITARKQSLGQGNIFSSVCQEFCPQGGVPGQVFPTREQTPPGADTPRTRYPPPEQTPCPLGPGTPHWEQTNPRRSTCWEIRSTSGRYASYWNAILLTMSL